MPLYCERAAISGLIKRNIVPYFFLQNNNPYQAVSYSTEHIIHSPCFFVCLFVCLYVGLRPIREFFIHLETTITDEVLPILTYTRHS